MTLDGGSSLGKSTGEEGGDDGKGGAIDLTNPNGGRELLDGVGDGPRVGHALDEDGDEGLDVGVGEDVTEVDSSVESSLGDLVARIVVSLSSIEVRAVQLRRTSGLVSLIAPDRRGT